MTQPTYQKMVVYKYANKISTLQLLRLVSNVVKKPTFDSFYEVMSIFT